MAPDLGFATSALEQLSEQTDVLDKTLREVLDARDKNACFSTDHRLPLPSMTTHPLILAIFVRSNAQNFSKDYVTALADELYRLVEEKRRFAISLGQGQVVQSTPGPLLSSTSK